MRWGGAGDRPGHPTRAWLAAALLVLAAAVFAFGRVSQESTPASTSSHPPASPLPLRITEPPDGAIIPGRSVRVAVARTVLSGSAPAPSASSVTPSEPEVLVFLDGAQKATIPPGQSSVTIDDVPPGRHKLTLVAGGQGREALDRKDASFTTAAVAVPAAGPAAEPVSPTASNGLPAAAPLGLLLALSALVLLTLGASLLASRRRARN